MNNLKHYLGGLYGTELFEPDHKYLKFDLPEVIYMQPTVEDIVNKLDKEIEKLKRKLFWTKIVLGTATILNLSLLIYQIYHTFVK